MRACAWVVAVSIAVTGVAHADTPESRGKAILAAQVDAVKHWGDAAPMRATFATGAVALLPNGEQLLDDSSDIASAIADLNPHSYVRQATFDHVTAGGNAAVAWFAAELHFTVIDSEPGYGATTRRYTVRAVELLDGAAGWKVAVAAFTRVAKLEDSGAAEIHDATDAGPLVKLLVAPDALGAALDAANAVAFGTDPDERGSGRAAKALVGRWSKLKLALDSGQNAREAHTASYGYAMTNVKLGTNGMSAFVLALPGTNGTWSVVAVSYGATF